LGASLLVVGCWCASLFGCWGASLLVVGYWLLGRFAFGCWLLTLTSSTESSIFFRKINWKDTEALEVCWGWLLGASLLVVGALRFWLLGFDTDYFNRELFFFTK
jgi:hypothetical protein